jgi:hypothetical protein
LEDWAYQSNTPLLQHSHQRREVDLKALEQGGAQGLAGGGGADADMTVLRCAILLVDQRLRGDDPVPRHLIRVVEVELVGAVPRFVAGGHLHLQVRRLVDLAVCPEHPQVLVGEEAEVRQR